MFRLYDTRTGKAEEIAPPAGGLLRMLIAGPPRQRRADARDLRSFLLADLIRRNAEHQHNLSVLACLVAADPGQDAGRGDAGGGTGDAGGYDDALRADAMALNLRPAERTASRSTEAVDGLAEMITASHILVDARSRPAPGDVVGPAMMQRSLNWMSAGQVLFGGRESADSRSDGTAPQVGLADLAERGLDPLALRLAYLSARYRDRAELTWDTLRDTDRELSLWRQRVAQWAESPSKPMCAEVTARVRAAFDDDLDTPAALRALRELEQDPDIPPGSKFESFVHADLLLGLELPRDIGRLPVPRNDSPS
jgi:hypothetical protein